MFDERIKQLREQRAALIAQAGEVLKPAQTEKRNVTEDEMTKWRGLHADAKALDDQAKVLEEQRNAETQLLEGVGRRAATGLESPETRKAVSQDPKERAEQERRAYAQWLRVGAAHLTDEARAILAGLSFVADEKEQAEIRAQAAGVAAKGGYTVPEGPMQPIEVAMKAFGGILDVAQVITTDHGRDIPWPTSDDTSNEGELISENDEVEESEVAYGEKVLKAYKFSSKLIRVPRELLEDSGIDVVGHIGGALGERLGRSINRYGTLGTGTDQPLGVLTAATLGKTAAAAAALAFGDLFDLVHSIDPAYRIGPKVRHMLADGTLAKWKAVVDGGGHLIFQRDLAGGTPATLDGFGFVINQNMPAVATGQKVQLFGDFSKFVVRRVRGIRVVRLEERFAERDQVGFVAFHRFDSRLIDAGTNPIKYLQMA